MKGFFGTGILAMFCLVSAVPVFAETTDDIIENVVYLGVNVKTLCRIHGF